MEGVIDAFRRRLSTRPSKSPRTCLLCSIDGCGNEVSVYVRWGRHTLRHVTGFEFLIISYKEIGSRCVERKIDLRFGMNR